MNIPQNSYFWRSAAAVSFRKKSGGSGVAVVAGPDAAESRSGNAQLFAIPCLTMFSSEKCLAVEREALYWIHLSADISEFLAVLDVHDFELFGVHGRVFAEG